MTVTVLVVELHPAADGHLLRDTQQVVVAGLLTARPPAQAQPEPANALALTTEPMVITIVVVSIPYLPLMPGAPPD